MTRYSQLKIKCSIDLFWINFFILENLEIGKFRDFKKSKSKALFYEFAPCSCSRNQLIPLELILIEQTIIHIYLVAISDYLIWIVSKLIGHRLLCSSFFESYLP